MSELSQMKEEIKKVKALGQQLSKKVYLIDTVLQEMRTLLKQNNESNVEVIRHISDIHKTTGELCKRLDELEHEEIKDDEFGLFAQDEE